MAPKPTTPDHEAFFQDLIALMNKHAGKLDSSEMLAISANVVGKIIAMQDQRTMTQDKAMEIVAKNIEMGNRQVIDEMAKGILGQE